MSCIKKILEIKGENPILVVNDCLAIEGGGEYLGYEYIITFIDIGHRCGYVAIPPDHPVYGHNLVCQSFNDFDFEVHGGITFHDSDIHVKSNLSISCADEWIGFDAAHGMDKPCYRTAKEYFPNSRHAQALSAFDAFYDMPEIVHRTYKYMESQCKKLVEQLIEAKNIHEAKLHKMATG